MLLPRVKPRELDISHLLHYAGAVYVSLIVARSYFFMLYHTCHSPIIAHTSNSHVAIMNYTHVYERSFNGPADKCPLRGGLDTITMACYTTSIHGEGRAFPAIKGDRMAQKKRDRSGALTCRHCGATLTPDDSEIMELCQECEAELVEAEKKEARHG